MTLFRWRSEYLKRYSSGHLIAVAATPDAARKLIMKEFEAHSWERLFPYPGFVPDEDDKERLEDFRKAILKDLAGDPEFITSGVLFIEGSE